MVEDDRHNVHFSPLTYFTRYGIIFTVTFYTFIMLYFVYMIKYIKYADNYYRLLVFYQIFAFVMSFISFSLPLDLFFWISIGLTLQTRDRINKNLKNSEKKSCVE